MTAFSETDRVARTTAHVDSGGTMWRLRSLVAMGHDATRIARALGVHPQTVQKILRDDADTITRRLRDRAVRLWDAWWDKRPPEQTRSQRRAAAAARRQAERLGWCAPLGLDEDELDEPGYRPYARYRDATGTGTAGEFRHERDLAACGPPKSADGLGRSPVRARQAVHSTAPASSGTAPAAAILGCPVRSGERGAGS